MSWTVFVGLGLAVLAGAVIQSSIGFGTAVVAAPLVVLVAPQLMPGALLVASLTIPVVQLAFGQRDIHWNSLAWAIGARLILTPVGVAIVAWFSPRFIAAGVGILILITVALSIGKLDLRATPGNATTAGAISGVAGTAASIGGPFFALVLQHEGPERVRSTLASFFLAGMGLSLIGLAIAGELTRQECGVGIGWVPFALVGYALGAPVRRRLDQQRLRVTVLAFCVVASIVVILRAVLI